MRLQTIHAHRKSRVWRILHFQTLHSTTPFHWKSVLGGGRKRFPYQGCGDRIMYLGARGHGASPARLSLVELSCQRRRQQDTLVTPHEQYEGLARNEPARREAYRALFKAHLDPEVISQIRLATNGNVVLGGKRFEEQIAKMLKRRVTRGKAGRPSQRADELDQQKQY